MTIIEDYTSMKQTLATAHRQVGNYTYVVWPEHRSKKAINQMYKMAWEEINGLFREYCDGEIDAASFEYKMKVLQDLKDSIEAFKPTGRR